MRPPANNALARLGTLSITLNDELRPGWLAADGTTEYERSAYPAFVTKFSTKTWFLAGVSHSKFKLLDIRDLALIVAGKGTTLGAVSGIAEYELTTDNLPEHSHTYDQPGLDAPENVNVIGSILGGVLKGLTLARPKITAGVASGKAGKPTASIKKIPITPRSIGVNVFVFAGLPQG
jgi:hypothetical protein